MTLLKESELIKLSLSFIHHYWDGRYKEDYVYRKENFTIPQAIWSDIMIYGIPSGSDWQNYIGYNSIRIFPVNQSGKTYIVLSVSKVSKGIYATTPSSYIGLFLLQDFQCICSQELSWFLREIYLLLGISSYDFTEISSDVCQVKLPPKNRYQNHNICFELMGFRSALPEKQMMFEAFFISQFFFNFCALGQNVSNSEEILSISSLCTPQDNVEKFSIFGIFQDESIIDSKCKFYKLGISSGKINIEKESKWATVLKKILNKNISLSLFLCLILAIILYASGYLVGYSVGSNFNRPSISESVDLSGADLSGADLSGANLSGVNFKSADLSGANFESADLSGANFESADLSDANLKYADLSGADLSDANLKYADFFGASFKRAYLTKVINLTSLQIKSVCFWQEAIFYGDYNRENQTYESTEPENTNHIKILKEDRLSDPQFPPDCSYWEKTN